VLGIVHLTVSLVTVLVRATVPVAPGAARRGIVKQKTLPAPEVLSSQILPPWAVVGTWDRFRLEQVVNNLLSNAIKFVELAEQPGREES
jgi:signal transduction histidine kinase